MCTWSVTACVCWHRDPSAGAWPVRGAGPGGQTGGAGISRYESHYTQDNAPKNYATVQADSRINKDSTHVPFSPHATSIKCTRARARACGAQHIRSARTQVVGLHTAPPLATEHTGAQPAPHGVTGAQISPPCEAHAGLAHGERGTARRGGGAAAAGHLEQREARALDRLASRGTAARVGRARLGACAA